MTFPQHCGYMLQLLNQTLIDYLKKDILQYYRKILADVQPWQGIKSQCVAFPYTLEKLITRLFENI